MTLRVVTGDKHLLGLQAYQSIKIVRALILLDQFAATEL